MQGWLLLGPAQKSLLRAAFPDHCHLFPAPATVGHCLHYLFHLFSVSLAFVGCFLCITCSSLHVGPRLFLTECQWFRCYCCWELRLREAKAKVTPLDKGPGSDSASPGNLTQALAPSLLSLQTVSSPTAGAPRTRSPLTPPPSTVQGTEKPVTCDECLTEAQVCRREPWAERRAGSSGPEGLAAGSWHASSAGSAAPPGPSEAVLILLLPLLGTRPHQHFPPGPSEDSLLLSAKRARLNGSSSAVPKASTPPLSLL